MRRALAFILLLLVPGLVANQGRAQTPSVTGRVENASVVAPALAGNRLGTATTQHAAVYLPPSYARADGRRYPVIYLLHGIADSHETWLRLGLPAMLDRLIAANRIPEVIVVMPDGGNVYGGGFYRNSPVSGNWGDYVADDLRRFVDGRYRTLARPGGRAITGWSMGGYGAIHLAMERPGLYSVVYAVSPCCLAPVEDLGVANDAWRRVAALRGAADIQAAIERRDLYTLGGVGLLTAFSPAPDSPPFYYRAPFRIVQQWVVPDDTVYDLYVAQFPFQRLAQARPALAGLRGLALDYGIGDQFPHIPPTSREFSNRLAELRIPHRFEVYDGGHRDQIPARLEAIVLPYVANLLDRPE